MLLVAVKANLIIHKNQLNLLDPRNVLSVQKSLPNQSVCKPIHQLNLH